MTVVRQQTITLSQLCIIQPSARNPVKGEISKRPARKFRCEILDVIKDRMRKIKVASYVVPDFREIDYVTTYDIRYNSIRSVKACAEKPTDSQLNLPDGNHTGLKVRKPQLFQTTVSTGTTEKKKDMNKKQNSN